MFSGEMPPHVQAKRLARQLTGSSRPTPGYIDGWGHGFGTAWWLFNVTGSAAIPQAARRCSHTPPSGTESVTSSSTRCDDWRS